MPRRSLAPRHLVALTREWSKVLCQAPGCRGSCDSLVSQRLPGSQAVTQTRRSETPSTRDSGTRVRGHLAHAPGADRARDRVLHRRALLRCVLDGTPDAFGGAGHVDVGYAEVAERGDDGVVDRRRGSDGARFADALGTEWVA